MGLIDIRGGLHKGQSPDFRFLGVGISDVVYLFFCSNFLLLRCMFRLFLTLFVGAVIVTDPTQ